jgi:hypothetical protein
MNVVNTIAPIKIEDLKKYFEDKNTTFVVDIESSQLSESKLLTYFSNLDLPIDISSNNRTEKFYELLSAYFRHQLILNLPTIENAAIDVLLEFRSINNFGYDKFIEENREIIQQWSDILDSMPLFNMYCIDSPEIKSWAENHPINEMSTSEGINFVSLLKHERFYEFYKCHDASKAQFYKNYFTMNMFKGSNLYSYWSNEFNPLFLLTFGIANSLFENKEYIEAVKESKKEVENVPSV